MTTHKWLPSEPTDEMKLAMANAFIASLQVAQKEGYDLMDANTCSTILGFVFEQGWKATPEVEQEPVAYECRVRIVQGGSFDEWLRCSKEFYEKTKDNLIDGAFEWEARPLYTHSQPKD